MKHWARILPLSALVLLCGCGGGGVKGAGGAGGGIPGSTSHGVNIAGNWQFSTTSTAGMPPATIAGSVAQSGVSVSGAVHVDGSNCFDHLTTVGLTGTLTGSDISLTSASVAGQLITFTGTISDDALNGTDSAFAGTYTINGCANGDQGNVTGIKIPYIANILNGTFTASGGGTFDVAGDIAQDSTSSDEGSFGVTGTVTFSTSSCFSSGTITSGTFPSGSFIMGTSVALEIETDNGTVTFLGTLNRDRSEIRGAYTVVGGTCDDTGTAVLAVSSPWDY